MPANPARACHTPAITRKVAATTVSPLAHGDSRWSGLVSGRGGIWVLTSGSFVEGSVIGRVTRGSSPPPALDASPGTGERPCGAGRRPGAVAVMVNDVARTERSRASPHRGDPLKLRQGSSGQEFGF